MLGPIAIRLPADAPRGEPIRVALHVLVVFMHVVDDEVHHHAHAVVVSRLDHGVEFGFRPKPWFNPPRFGGPVAVEGRNIVDAVGGFAG